MTYSEKSSSIPQPAKRERFNYALKSRYRLDQVFAVASWLAVAISLIVLLALLIDVLVDGWPRLDWTLISEFPSRRPGQAGLKSALVGSIWLMIITAIISFPIGVGSAIFLEEFAADTWIAKVVEVNINNLAAVPSIIYGLLGLELFVRIMEPITNGRSILAGALTLSLLILPIIIVTTRESLRAVPSSLRQAGFALGGTRWQVVKDHVFPLAFPGILTGIILALSRAIGETAPLITIGALTFIAFLPSFSLEGLRTPFTALPIQIFNWVSRPQPAFHTVAAAGIIVLMVVLILMNGIAIWLRNKFQKDINY